MTTEEIIEQIKEMKPRYDSFSAKDKKNLKIFVKELGIKHKFGNCSNCYKDAFHLIVNTLGMTSADFIEPKVSSKTYTFLGQTDTIWHGPYGNIVMNEYTQEEIIEKYIDVFPNQQQYVVKDETLEISNAEINEEELLLG